MTLIPKKYIRPALFQATLDGNVEVMKFLISISTKKHRLCTKPYLTNKSGNCIISRSEWNKTMGSYILINNPCVARLPNSAEVYKVLLPYIKYINKIKKSTYHVLVENLIVQENIDNYINVQRIFQDNGFLMSKDTASVCYNYIQNNTNLRITIGIFKPMQLICDNLKQISQGESIEW